MVVVLPAPFTPASRITNGYGRVAASGFSSGARSAVRALAKLRLELRAVLQALVAGRLAQAPDQVRGRVHADVGLEQLGFESLVERLVDHRMRTEDPGDLVQAFAGERQPALQAGFPVGRGSVVRFLGAEGEHGLRPVAPRGGSREYFTV